MYLLQSQIEEWNFVCLLARNREKVAKLENIVLPFGFFSMMKCIECLLRRLSTCS